jgi:hypothetical protein
MRLITYAQDNGHIAVICPAHQSGDFAELIASQIPETPHKIVNADSLNIDNDYFDAYEFDADAGAVLNMDKAKAIRLDQFREARKPLLEALDVDYMRALEVEDSVAAAAIAVRKQELRDVTKLPLPDSLDELKAFLPSALNP